MLERTPTSDLKHPTRRNIRRRVKRALKQQRPWLAIDAESRSPVNLPDTGPHVYSIPPQTEVRKLAMLAHDGSVSVWHSGDPPSPLFIKAVREGWDIIIHNAPFDHTLLVHNLHVRHGFPKIPYDRCIDTMTRALARGLPASLGDLADALETTHRKDRILERQNRKGMKPRKPKKGENPNILHYHAEPGDEYATQDVRVLGELHLHKHLPKLIPIERALELHTHTVNERGFLVDVPLAEAICKLTQQAIAEINAKLTKITGGKVTSVNQVGKLFEFAKTLDYRGQSFDRDAIGRQLKKKGLNPLLRRVLSLRLQVGSAVKKFHALLTCVSLDGRVRFTLQFHAAATGRWGGRRYQPQNLRRLTLSPEEVETAVTAVKTGDFKHLKKLYGDNLLEVMGEMGRPAIISSPGHLLIGGDLSSIESRILAWIADERWKLDSYRLFDATQDPRHELYCETACRIKRKPSGTFTKTSPERAIGKVCDLAFGYQGGKGAFYNFMPEGYTDEEIETFKRDWRTTHPAISRWWRLVDKATVLAIENPGETIVCGRYIELKSDGAFLRIRLPSGRPICYPRPTIIEGTYGNPCVSFYDNSASQFRPCRNGQGGFGGLWTENIVQGIARDILGAALLRLEAANYPVIMHVQDEAICEIPRGFGSVEEFRHLLTQKPRWALSLPVSASAWMGTRYCSK